MTSHDWYSTWKGWDRRDFGKPSRDESAYFDAELGPFVADAKVRVLELGFGNGEVLGWCRARGHDCTGVESSPLLVAKALESGFDAVVSLAEARDRYGNHAFDLAVAFDVLEHVSAPDIAELLREIHVLLKPEAVLIVRFPNGDSPWGRAYQHGDITHVTVLGSRKIQWLATQAGFSVDRLKEPAIPLRGAGVLRICKRLSAKAIRLILDSLVSYAYFSGAVCVFSASLVAVLRASIPVPLHVDRTEAIAVLEARTDIPDVSKRVLCTCPKPQSLDSPTLGSRSPSISAANLAPHRFLVPGYE
jgi:SAM-dependent methyltransferase